MGSISTAAASVKAIILSACGFQIEGFIGIGTFTEVTWRCGFGVRWNRTYGNFNAFIGEDEGSVCNG
jgi:hypothetical protein